MVRTAPPIRAVPYESTGELLLVVLLGLGLGASALVNGLYDVGAWGPVALATTAVLIAAVLSQTVRVSLAPGLAAAGLLGLALVCWLSQAWADDDSAALTEAARWAGYAVLLLALLALVRTARAKAVLHGALLVAVAALALYVEAHLLGGDAGDWFVGRRLNEPVGYFNGQAAFALFSFWLLLGRTERAGRAGSPLGAAVAGVGVAFGVLLVAQVLLTGTRAAIPAIAVSAAAVLVLLPGRVRRGWMLLAVAAGTAVAARPALDVFSGDQRVLPTAAEVNDAARKALLGAVLAGVAFALLDLLVQGGARRAGERRRVTAHRALGTVMAVGAVTVVVVGLAAGGYDRIHRQYTDFVNLRSVSPTESRLLSGGGNRYDYWRVAVAEWRANALGGLGAGNFTQEYFARRRQTEAVQQAHSLELQTLSETGLLGALALVALFGGIATALARLVTRAREPESIPLGAAVGGVGVLVTWVVQTSVDWLHLLPGLTGLALAALVLLTPAAPAEATAATPRRRIATSAFAVLAALVALLTVGRVVLADRYLTTAREHAAAQPAVALADIGNALRFDGDDADAYYLRAGILAAQDRYDDARGALLAVIADQPRNYLPYQLLGDLAMRRGDAATALRDYRAAAERNPRDLLIQARIRQAQGRPG